MESRGCRRLVRRPAKRRSLSPPELAAIGPTTSGGAPVATPVGPHSPGREDTVTHLCRRAQPRRPVRPQRCIAGSGRQQYWPAGSCGSDWPGAGPAAGLVSACANGWPALRRHSAGLQPWKACGRAPRRRQDRRRHDQRAAPWAGAKWHFRLKGRLVFVSANELGELAWLRAARNQLAETWPSAEWWRQGGWRASGRAVKGGGRPANRPQTRSAAQTTPLNKALAASGRHQSTSASGWLAEPVGEAAKVARRRRRARAGRRPN